MRAPIILRVFRGDQLVEVKQFDLDQIVIGRQADVQIDLPSDDVSPIHCLIERRDTGFFVCDLGSTSGTKKNGNIVLDELLSSGDELTIGPFRLVFYVGVPKPKTVPSMSPVGETTGVYTGAVIPPPPKAEAAPAPAKPAEKPPTPKPPDARPPVKGEEIPERPELRSRETLRSSRKSVKTYAPPSEIKDLRSHLKATKGNVVEVVVAWKERIIDTYHFRAKGSYKLGHTDRDSIRVNAGSIPRSWQFLEIGSAVRVNVADSMEFELISSNGSRRTMDNCLSTGKASRAGGATAVRLDQNEMIWLSAGDIHLYVRFVPQTATVPLVPPLGLSGTELSGVVASLMMTALLAFYISATTPKDLFETPEEEITRTAQVIFNNPPSRPNTPPEPPTPPPEPPPQKPPPPQKAKVTEEKLETQKKGQKTDKAAQKPQVAARAAEVAPIPNSKNRPKKFTSRKQGGAVKIGDKEGSNAASTKDVSKIGLFSAFGGGGVRQKLDQAYSGAGEVLGQADRATGTTGFGADRPGDDLGSRFKDTGAGGKGTATQGIAGVGTRGRGSGQAAYGAVDGFGSKTVTIVDPGDADEDFVGTIDKEAIRRRVRHYLHEIRGCYTRELNKLEKGQKLEGKVVIRWEIIARGVARGVAVKSSTLGNRAVENCIRDRLASWSFPEPPNGMTAEVSYPFYLRPEN